ncbi:21739_t:CDS:1, partial [Gigaspora rosea]
LSASPLNFQDTYYIATLKHIKEIKSTIWKSRNAEVNLQQSEKIKFYTNRRYNDFKDNTSRMINSILKKGKDHISFDKIVTPDS